MALQTNYEIYRDKFKVGLVSRPWVYTEYATGTLSVGSGESAPRAGDSVYYDDTSHTFKVPQTATNALKAVGLLVLPSTAVGAADGTFTFSNNEYVQIMIAGVMAVRAGAAVEFGDKLVFQGAAPEDHDYLILAPGSTDAVKVNAYVRNQGICVSPQPIANTKICELRLSGAITY